MVIRIKQKRLKTSVSSLKCWSECGDLNPGPLGPEPSALPSALHPESVCRENGSPRQLLHYNDSKAPCQAQIRRIEKDVKNPDHVSLEDGHNTAANSHEEKSQAL